MNSVLDRQCLRDYLTEYIFTTDKNQNSRTPGKVGLELEMFPLKKQDNRVTPCSQRQVALRLRQLAKQNQWQLVEEPCADEQENLLTLVVTDQHENFSFEPGGQLEYSTRPYHTMRDLYQQVEAIYGKLEALVADDDIRFLQMGTNPWHTTEEIGLQMPKKRYMAMDSYFHDISVFGRQMMRQTCTNQVCLDFGADVDTLIKRYLLANLASPLATAIFAYSPYLEGQDTDLKSTRSQAWRYLDPSRTGLPNLGKVIKAFTYDALIDSYLDFALDSNLIFIEELDYQAVGAKMPFAAWLDGSIGGKEASLKDFILQLSLLFPEVRPKGFLEIRSIDSQARPWQMVPAAFFAGLLYNQDALNAGLDLLIPESAHTGEWLEWAKHGLDHPTIRRYAQKIMEIAARGYKRLPMRFRDRVVDRSFAGFRELFTERSLTPADDLLAEVRSSDERACTLPLIDRLTEKWQNQLVKTK